MLEVSCDALRRNEGFGGDHLRYIRKLFLLGLTSLIPGGFAPAQEPQPANSLTIPAPHVKQVHLKHILVIAQTKGLEHDSIPDGMAAIFKLAVFVILGGRFVRVAVGLAREPNDF